MPEFSATDFITRLGRSLIKEFEEARQATTSQLIGVAIETPVRRRLEQVRPPTEEFAVRYTLAHQFISET